LIVRDKPGLLQLLTAARGSVLPHIALPLASLIVLSALMVLIDHHLFKLPESPATPFSVLGVALSLFLGFRNNAAYDRWWEARRLWGGLVADCRALARELDLFLPDAGPKHRILRLALAFLHLHRLNLRRQSPDDAARTALQAAGGAALLAAPHPPDAALDALNAAIAAALRSGAIDGFAARTLTTRLGSIALNQAGCERIATTPLPYVYSLLIFRTIYLYLALIPLALIGPEGWLTPLFVGFMAYVFLGLAEVTEDLAHPFGETLNALPLNAICRAVEISLAPHLDEPAPQPLGPVDFHLN
jgi:ion channel-forming bestrophin family protein